MSGTKTLLDSGLGSTASKSVDARSADQGGVSVDADAKSTPSDPPGKPVTPANHRPPRKRRLLIGALAVLALAVALWFGIPWVWFALNTVSTDDAYVNDHVTFVAARVRGAPAVKQAGAKYLQAFVPQSPAASAAGSPAGAEK